MEGLGFGLMIWRGGVGVFILVRGEETWGRGQEKEKEKENETRKGG